MYMSLLNRKCKSVEMDSASVNDMMISRCERIHPDVAFQLFLRIYIYINIYMLLLPVLRTIGQSPLQVFGCCFLKPMTYWLKTDERKRRISLGIQFSDLSS